MVHLDTREHHLKREPVQHRVTHVHIAEVIAVVKPLDCFDRTIREVVVILELGVWWVALFPKFVCACDLVLEAQHSVQKRKKCLSMIPEVFPEWAKRHS